MASSSRLSALLITLLLSALASAHLVLVYPGSRGNNLITSGRTQDDQIPTGSLGENFNNATGEYEYPYGMQWMYPCGGLGVARNRTKWPVKGGAISFQPGWFNGHQTAFVYINLGFGTEPLNYSNPMVPVFQMTGPTNQMYPGTFCLPQVPLPVNASVKVGDNATIQVIETAVHGAALYSCVDITFADPADVAPVNSSNCFNSTGNDGQGGPMGVNYVFTTKALSGALSGPAASWTLLGAALGATALTLLL
ncbi:hypothetical protein EJ06DRAFT_116019 [Trichodelitschia bisporula]|uniref:Copper acquisition factor BIM1-like domain-containing protein n=1 Tax=Trichodelitschia bisporula TaxID=703511 RepID=A0A6G1HPP4_9PEZI|nr:hypothetical protein EJ06DRAFT_116019 [Trichodelitschia bisporula]